MKEMEVKIYNLVKNNRKLKNILVTIYQAAFGVIGYLKPRVISKYEYVSLDNCFFGFHDKHSINKEGLVLAHRELGAFKDGKGNASVGYFELNKPDDFIEISTTKCCNYQQGSMLCWYDENSVIFNDYDEGKAISRVLELDGRERKRFPFHFFSHSSNFLSSIDFFIFDKGMSGYGYSISSPESKNDAISEFKIYSISESKFIYNINLDEAEKLTSAGFNGVRYFSHSSFSPDNKFCYFLYRNNDGMKNSSVLLVYDLINNVTIPLPTSGMVSHLCWFNDNEILAYCSVDNVDAYYRFEFSEGSTVINKVDNTFLRRDGHPTYFKGSNDTFVTDCYPNRERRQSLYLVKDNGKTCETIFDVFSMFKYKGVNRVDFHPRYSECGMYVSIDSPHMDTRSQIVIKLK